MNNAHWLKSREIAERIIVHGDLILETPAGFGTGDSDMLTDIPLALDPLEAKALLTGASLAGALRNYLREREYGYRQKSGKGSFDWDLFGMQEEKEGEQSLLIINDSLVNESKEDKPKIELRDGVKIDPRTRTALDKKKFDFELLEAGTSFPIRIELLVREDRRERLMQGLVIALQGLERSEIRLGIRKRRGFGKCGVKEWSVCRYDLTKPQGLIGWLTNDLKGTVKGEKIADLLGFKEKELEDNRKLFTMEAIFSLDGSLLIRSGSDSADAPDSVHLQSKRNGESKPVLSGTSLAGALRARALRISRTIDNNGNSKKIVEDLFGPDIDSIYLFCWDEIPGKDETLLIDSIIKNFYAKIARTARIEKLHDSKTIRIFDGTNTLSLELIAEKNEVNLTINGSTSHKLVAELKDGKRKIYSKNKAFASKLISAETEIINPLNLVQSRIKTDRFNGGSFPTALFEEQPVFKQNGTTINVNITMQDPSDAQIGLLLLLLKDLWTGDLPLGGESSIGRGRLKGMVANMIYKQVNPEASEMWTITQADGRLDIKGDRSRLEKFVEIFWRGMQ